MITVNHCIKSGSLVQFLLALGDDIMVGVAQEIIKRIDMYGDITPFPLMDEGFFVIRISADIDIRTVAGKNVVTVAGDIGKRGATFSKEW